MTDRLPRAPASMQPVARLDVRFGEDTGRRVLLVDGTVQSVIEPRFDGYWAAMVPDRRPRHTLLLGLGGATVAALLHERFGPVPVTGVELNPDVIRVADPIYRSIPSLSVVEADAFGFVQNATGPYDLICIDLYRGERLAAAITHLPFLRRIRELLAPGGDAVFNLFLDRSAIARTDRIRRALTVNRCVVVKQNVLVWASSNKR
ncbi:MAG: hypothetical protein U0821_01455 [Chloroflexota bacterium]